MTTAIQYALMAGRAYLTNRGQINQFPIAEGWQEFFHTPDPATSFQRQTDKRALKIRVILDFEQEK